MADSTFTQDPAKQTLPLYPCYLSDWLHCKSFVYTTWDVKVIIFCHIWWACPIYIQNFIILFWMFHLWFEDVIIFNSSYLLQL